MTDRSLKRETFGTTQALLSQPDLHIVPKAKPFPLPHKSICSCAKVKTTCPRNSWLQEHTLHVDSYVLHIRIACHTHSLNPLIPNTNSIAPILRPSHLSHPVKPRPSPQPIHPISHSTEMALS